MAFDAPTLAEMRAVVGRALRDPNGKVFAPDAVNDFITTALSDLSIYRPVETMVVSTWPPPDPPAYSDVTSVWMVQYAVPYSDDPNNVSVTTVPPTGSASGDARAGWDFYASALTLGAPWRRALDALVAQGYAPELRVWGYADRALPVTDADILDLRDNTDLLCVVSHCKHLGYELLNHDRSLYQQWLSATNNTDVSPTQLQGMTAVAEQTYERQRSRNTMLRRVPSAGNSAFAY